MSWNVDEDVSQVSFYLTNDVNLRWSHELLKQIFLVKCEICYHHGCFQIGPISMMVRTDGVTA